jgi:hypothetical protein
MSDDDQTKPIPVPPTDVVTTRLDGWLAPEADPDHPPPAVAAMILIPRHDDADVVTAIRERMLARHRAAGLKIDDEF